MQRLGQALKQYCCCSSGTNEDEHEEMNPPSNVVYNMFGSYQGDQTNKVLHMNAYFDEICDTNISSSDGQMQYRLEFLPGTTTGSARLNVQTKLSSWGKTSMCTTRVTRNNNILTVQQPFSCDKNFSAFIRLDAKCGTYQPPSENIDMD